MIYFFCFDDFLAIKMHLNVLKLCLQWILQLNRLEVPNGVFLTA